MPTPTVYLAGHVHDAWRAPVAAELKGAGYNVVCPWDDVDRLGGKPARVYMVRDLLAIRQADIVLAVFDRSKPYKCVGTAAECGLAKGHGKILLVAFEHEVRDGSEEYPGHGSYDFPAGLADVVYDSLDLAMDALCCATAPNAWEKDR